MKPIPNLIALLILGSAAHAQGTRADYARADALPDTTRDRVTRNRVNPRWLPDESALWYRNDPEQGKREFVLIDIATKRRRPLFDHARLAQALQAAGHKDAPPDRLPIADLDLDATHLLLWLDGDARVWKCDRATYATEVVDAATTNRFRLPVAGADVRSRTGGGESAIVFVNATGGPVELFWIDMDAALRSYGKLAAGATRVQHTFAGHAWAVRNEQGEVVRRYRAADVPRIAMIDEKPREDPPPRARANPRRSADGQWRVDFRHDNVVLVQTSNNQEWPLSTAGVAANSFGGEVRWSPDSRHFVVLRTEAGDSRTIPIVESTPRDRLQPRLITVNYAKPGDRLPHPRPWLFDASTREGVEIDDTDFPNPWSLTHLRWTPDSRDFTFLYNQRGHQTLRVIAIDSATRKTRVLVDEAAKTFIDYAGKSYLQEIDATNELIWMSERDGWNHLYLYDRRTGRLKNPITHGAWAVRSVDRVDAKARRIWFWAGGVRPGEDPYYLHYCRADLDGGAVAVLTEGDGTHSVEFSPSRRTFVDTWSRVDLPPVRVLRAAEDGALICELERADWTELLATGWRPPERFVAKGRDGRTDIYGIIHRPGNFDPKRRYPVVEAIYAGPHAAHVPKTFQALHGAQVMAELGFLVVQIDGMGTSFRSKAFHDVCWKNLADAGFPDRIAWIKAAAQQHAEMDLTRVGIYGGSAGGQNAMGGLLAHPDFYRVGVADCGCHDNRMDKIWWNELWMGWPIGPHYAEQSNVTQAHKLQGKLMLIVGEVDTNVDPASTMQVVDALVRADKDFDLVVLPGVGHGASGTPYGQRRMRDFLVRHLHGVEPRRK